MLQPSFLSSSGQNKSRLAVCLVVLSICFGRLSEARPQPAVPRVALFQPGETSYSATLIDAFASGLKDVGLTVGTDVIIDYYYPTGRLNRIREIAKNIVALKPDVIVVSSTPLTEAVIRETTKIPIVMAAAGDPVGSGLVASLAQPGGNVTGTSMRSPEVSGKRLELIKELLPKARRIVIFWNSFNNSHLPTMEDSRTAARALNLELQAIAIQKPSDLKTAFSRFLGMKAEAFSVIRDPFLLRNRKQFIDFAAQKRIPAVYDGREFTLAGGLMSYTPNHLDLYRRAALYVTKILHGANPADLPIERTMRAHFIINLKAAKQIGLTIPPEMLTLADQVIE